VKVQDVECIRTVSRQPSPRLNAGVQFPAEP
jgi:hypothetical protein